MIDLHPKKCNICNGKVVFVSNSAIYGKEYGSGKCYLCKDCGAYAGTHEPRPSEALGILANYEMRDMKIKCHELFDKKWLSAKNKRLARKQNYKELAGKLGIPIAECHFGYFDMDMLKRAYEILEKEKEI